MESSSDMGHKHAHHWPAGGHCRLWRCSFCPSLHKGADNGPAAGWFHAHCPIHPSCLCFSSKLLTLVDTVLATAGMNVLGGNMRPLCDAACNRLPLLVKSLEKKKYKTGQESPRQDREDYNKFHLIEYILFWSRELMMFRVCPTEDVCLVFRYIMYLPDFTHLIIDYHTFRNHNLNDFLSVFPISNVCADLNECMAKPSICKNGRCENTVGSYRCKCDQGFIANPTQTECIGKDVVSSHIFFSFLILSRLSGLLLGM